MLGNFKIITSNHNTNKTSDLGSFMIKPGNEPNVFKSLKAIGVDEILYLSTCNRVLYLFYSNIDIDKSFIESFLDIIDSNINKIPDLLSKIEVYQGIEAVGHIMEVAGSIDSLVVGEREIFRQFRSAYEQSLELGFIKHNLKLLESLVVRTAKKIYTHTRIGEKPLSIASLALTTIVDNVDLSKSNNICLVGAGETNKLLSKLLLPKKLGKYTVYNRTESSGKLLAKNLGGNFYQLDELYNTNVNFDVIITATSSQKELIKSDLVNDLNQKYGLKKRIFIDLSVPPNIDPNISKLKNSILITIDDLKELAALNLMARKNEIAIAKKIVNNSKSEFGIKYQERKIELALADVPIQIKAMKAKAINNVFAKRLSEHPIEIQMLVEDMMEYMEKKCISIPMKAAKKGLL